MEPPARKVYTVGAYDAPERDFDPRPSVIVWFRVYAGVMLLGSLGLLGLAGLAAWAQTRPEVALARGAARQQTEAMILCFVALACVALYGVATFMPRKPWAWTLGLVVLALGLPSIAIVVCIPMLLAWTKPTVKAAFCRL